MVSTPESDWDCVVGFDLRGVYLSCKCAIPAIIDSGGAVVTVASIGALRGNSGASFCAAKGAVVNLTRSMALAHAAENARVNCVCLAGSRRRSTPGTWPVPSGGPWSKRPTPWRLGTVEEVTAAVAFLAGDEASFITGTILAVDGGYLAAGPFVR